MANLWCRTITELIMNKCRLRSARFRFNVDGSVVWLGPTTRMQFKVEPVKA